MSRERCTRSFARSPHAHAEIEQVDVAQAAVAPGVAGVFTAKDADVAQLLPLECLVEVPSHNGRPMARPPRLPPPPPPPPPPPGARPRTTCRRAGRG